MWLDLTCSLFILWVGVAKAQPVNLCTESPELYYQCKGTSKCISRSWFCDGTPDCPSGDDEGPLSCPLCPAGQFECAVDKTCIPQAWQCDGRPDCHDGSDESQETCDQLKRRPWSGAGFPVHFKCRPNQYQCPGTTTCIDMEKVCDARKDCIRDGADEGYFCTNADCGTKNCPEKCKETVEGALCYCKDGSQFNKNTSLCEDMNECSYEGYCDQNCSNSVGSYTCSCTDGYQLQDKTACKAVNDPHGTKEVLLVASMDGIQQYSTDGTKLQSFSQQQAQAMDFNHRNQSICWVRLGASPISGTAMLMCSSIDLKQTWSIKTQYKLNDVEQMALDWVTGNWYFTDKVIGRIFVCTGTGKRCRTILYTSHPGDIKLDPQMGFMFFTKSGSSAKVSRAAMDGSGKETELVSKMITRPRGLTLDYANKHVYWTDTYANYIQRITYFGKQRTVIMTGKWVDNIFGLAILENIIYGTDQQNGSIIRFHRHKHMKVEPSAIVSRQLKIPRAISIYHRQRQPKVFNQACANKGGCSHFCFPVYNKTLHASSPKCQCEIGFRLVNNTKCIATNSSNFLIYSSSRLKLIRGISPNKSDTVDAMPPLVDINNPGAVSYHAADGFIYYCHVHLSQGRIGRRKVDGSMRNDSFISKRIKQCEGLAVDWIGNNIFWTDGPLKLISVASLVDPNIRKAVISEGLTHPRAIAVDPDDGHMYFTDWVKSSDSSDALSHLAKIWRAGLDGSNMQVIVDASRPWPLYWPCGLALDLKKRDVYWAEAYYDRIEKITMDSLQTGHTPEMVLQKHPDLKHPLGLALNNNSLYWSEISKIVEFNLTSKRNVSSLRSDAYSYFDLKFFSKASQPVSHSVCAHHNGDCSDLCLQNSSLIRSCHCRDGYKFKKGSDLECEPNPDYNHTTGCRRDMEFQCLRSGVCIPKESLCDGEQDCQDASDEDRVKCMAKPCDDPERMHRCMNNRCIYSRWLCDGEDDCRSGQLDDEDPAKCTNKTCPEKYRRCSDTGRCYPPEWYCDHDYDCEDHSDEPAHCHDVTCSWDQYRCNNSQCIPASYVCDGDGDCKDGSDETDCQGKYNCNNETEITCKKGGRCLPKYYRCDGLMNCEDGSDEEDCVWDQNGGHGHFPENAFPDRNPDYSIDAPWTYPDEFNFQCEESEFKCNDGECIPGIWLCDREVDCGDSSDEQPIQSCNSTGTQSPTNQCEPDKFGCNSTALVFQCFERMDVMCDGIKDCMDNSDETAEECGNRPIPSVCRPGEYDCIGGSPRCVNLTKVCDNRPDCDHGADEGLFCSKKLCDLSSPCSHTCHNTPQGLSCSCPPGMALDVDDRNCIKVGCGWGICSQGCQALRGSRVYCTCNEGYSMEADGFTCKSNDGRNPFLIFSNRHEMRRLDIKTGAYVSLVSGLPNTIALDFHYKKQMLFWTDVVDDQISSGTMISNTLNNIKPVISVGLATAEGLAIDWIGDNIYWVESHLDQIEVARLNGSMRTTLVAGNMESPRAIVLDPRWGLLFWSDWHSARPRIERVSMSGEGRKTIVDIRPLHGAGWPNGMTLDYENVRLYWIDARSDSIHTVNYEGGDHRLVLRDHTHLFHPFAITTFGNHVYWTDWKTNSLIKANKWNGTDVKFVDRTITQPFDVHVYHSSRQPDCPNPCEHNNGGCSHLCLINSDPSLANTAHKTRAGCACPHLMKLMADKKTCEKNDKFLLYAKPNEIRGVDLIDADYNVIPSLTLPHISRPAAIDYDTKDGGKIYWTDSEKNVVNRVNLDLSGMETVTDSEIQHPEGFIIDWISGNMYFSTYNANGGKVSVSTLDGAYRVDLDLVTLKLKKPTSLAVHPQKGKLFIADTGSTKPTIYSGNMDGSEMDVLTVTTAAMMPQNLTVDTTNDLLFWVDALTNHINYCNLDGTKLQSILLPNITVDMVITAMTVYKEWIYFAAGTLHNGMIYKVKKDGTSLMIVRNNTAHVNSLKVYDADIRTGDNTCNENKGGCAQLCLPKSATESVCRCTLGYVLSASDMKSCIGLHSFLMYSTNFAIHGRSLKLPDHAALPPISQISEVVAIDYYAADDYIFWVNNKASTISRIKRDLTQREIIVRGGLMGVEGLAVDWAAGNLYWTDQGFGTIEVSRLNGSDRYVVLSNDTDKPSSIVVHPAKGLMIWSNFGTRNRIEIANLDGSNRRDLVNETIYQPSSIYLDFAPDGDYLYWCDRASNTIERVKLDGMVAKGRVTVLRNLTYCSAIAVYEDYVYWTEMETFKSRVMRTFKNGTTTSNMTFIKVNDFSTKKILNDLKIFDKNRQQTTNICSVKNGGCQDLCFYLGEGKRKCACAHGKASANGTTCEDHGEFILYSSISSIDGINIMDPDNKNAPIKSIQNATSMFNVIGLAFDFESKIVFFSDLKRGDIQRVFANGTGFETVVSGVGSAEGLAYNPTFKELYWTSYSNSSINRVSFGLRPMATGPNGVAVGGMEKYHRETVVQLDADDHPRSIVIDTCKSLLFWTNWNPKKPSIQRAYLGGWDVKAIITTNIRVPNGLVIDHRAQKLYWSDAGLDKIERCNFDGSNRTVIISVMPQHIFGMALHGDYLYWTDWVARAAVRANKYDGSGTKVLRKTDRQPMGIVAFAEETNNCNLNPCHRNNGGCAGTCNVDEFGNVICNCTKDGSCPGMKKACAWDDYRCGNGTCINIEKTCDGVRHCLDGGDEKVDYCRHRTCPDNYFRCSSSNKCLKWFKHCNRIDDCGDNSDEAVCPCPDDYFQCNNKTKHCILRSHVCDHHPDCQSGEDEVHCDNVDCNTFTYHGQETLKLTKCNTTTACVSPAWLCDGENDCWDNSDEKNCPTAQTNKTCGEGNFACESDKNTCIPLSWKCDKSPDCADKSDEKHCDLTCDENQIKCGTTANASVCIPKEWQCDGVKDCLDGSDEPDTCPGSKTCPPSYFTCDDGHCIPDDWLCDGNKDCGKGEDENVTRAKCVDRTCGPKEFRCMSGECVWFDFRCDHHHDCNDSSDEGPFCNYPVCKDGSDGSAATEYQCKNGQCIPLKQKCDGRYDCTDLSDETRELCTPKVCDKKFLCKSGKCLNNSLVCNGKDDCGDFSDEQYCHMNVCASGSRQNPCEYKCVDLIAGYRCECAHGYRLNKDNATCSDIDECQENLPCSHYCSPHNHGQLHTGFRCSCAKGFQLQADKRSCKVEKIAPYLLITNRYYIRNITFEGDMQLVTKALSNAVALDFDWTDQMIYWSDVTSMGSNISRISLQTNASRTPKPEVLHSTTLRNPDGIALDWLGRNLYWCDKTTDTIEVSNLDGKFRKVLANTGLQEPRALAVHPLRGYLFYTDWGNNAHIGRMGMDGGDRRFIVNQALGWPNALTVDYITDHIFWADARLDYIKMADLEGKNERVIIAQNLPHIFALTQFGDYLFWTDWEQKGIERANKFSGEDRKVLASMIHRPMDVHVIHPKRQPQPRINPCHKGGGCKNLCLIKSGGKGRTCACPENHYLAADAVSCISNCTTSQFKCRDTYKCIPFWNKCDRVDDCGDRSDEGPDCPPYFCPEPNMVQCNDSTKASSHCIPPSQVCDGVKQCRDGSDEQNCKRYTCLSNQFKCYTDSRCISLPQRCDGREDCLSGEDELNCPITSCPPTKFRCRNTGRCIPYVWRCDGANDCGDMSDEPHDCKNKTCLEGYFQCNSTGQCIPDKWKCDGEHDCGANDMTDEPKDECSQATCSTTYFKCENNRCIPGRWRCDYSNDCGDNSDEKGCKLRPCSESEFNCSNGHCIPHYWRCNGESDCNDGSDEKDCHQQCAGKFQCVSSNYCIPTSWKCDDEIDCADGSDESGCNKTCSTGEFACDNGHCIPGSWRCDGTDDCDDNSDELTGSCKNLTCPGRHQCPDGVCILPSQVCDGINHCADTSDEQNCTLGSGCKSEEFECEFTKQCIPKKNVCDKFTECEDGSDEYVSLCRNSVVDCGALKCEYKCTKIGSTAVCLCPDHKQLAPNGRNCIDVNQCKIWRTCEQKCEKNRGGHKCSCADGYINVAVETNGPPVCKAQGNHPYLLMSVENVLRSVSLNLGQAGFGVFTEIHKHTKKVEAIDAFINPNAKAGEDNITIFAATYQPAAILRMPFNDKEVVRTKRSVELSQDPQALPLEGLQELRGLAVDWISKRIYWTDAGQDKIEMANFDGTDRRTVISTDLDQPHRIVAHPQSSKIYWTDWGVNAKIEKANLDGSNRTTLVTYDLIWPTGLAIDYPNERLYFADTKKGTIETVNLDGSDRRIVKTFQRNDDKPYMLDIFENSLYVTTYKNNDVFKINKYNASKQTYIVRNMPSRTRVGHIVIIQEQKQTRKVPNPCSQLLCPGLNTLCINLPFLPPNDHSCICPNGYSRNGHDCLPAKDCPKDLCMNGGVCQRAENNQPKCSCPKRYYGAFCQNERCYKNICLHNGTCNVDDKLQVSCSCPMEYSGSRCEVHKCTSYCQNNGNCTVVPTGKAFCECPFDYGGPQCHTKRTDLCKDYCLNGALCVVTGEAGNERPTCACRDGFTGERCDQCKDHKCYFGGYCNKNKSCSCPIGLSVDYNCKETDCKGFCANNATCRLDDKMKPVCVCPPRYHSLRCHLEMCEGFCKRGNCSYDDNDQPKCTCPPSYRGSTCDQLISTCYEGLCKNNGMCKLDKNEAGNPPTCICQPGFTGNLCEIAPGCDNFICEHHGYCVQDTETKMPTCICSHFWTGTHCAEPSSVQCKNYCFNNSTCIGCTIENADYSCKECTCAKGWKGPRCEDRDFSVGRRTGQLEGSTIAAVVVPILICLIIFTLVAGVCIFRKKYSNKQFHHARLVDNSNVEISNPIYRAGMEEETNVDIEQPFDPERVLNYTNPMYQDGMLFSDGTTPVRNEEKKELLDNDQLSNMRFGED
ncbi:low-density lipoprotein receptor-related protein 1-like isoform X2 [Lineus longissimus]|uniref:low-density lipoprotein receptor-related protein 1-like isoform X2 n=1 Tax=Lineus longissimus TaxID=88925 RepID=UPI00315DDC35